LFVDTNTDRIEKEKIMMFRATGRTIVVGSFKNSEDASEAINNLNRHGFAQQEVSEVIVLDQTDLPETAIAAPNSATPSHVSAQDAQPGVVVSATPDGDERESEGSWEETLVSLGVDNVKAAIYAQHAARGNPLVIIRTNQERAEEALKILEQADGWASIS
jgi:hypothetical protein